MLYHIVHKRKQLDAKRKIFIVIVTYMFHGSPSLFNTKAIDKQWVHTFKKVRRALTHRHSKQHTDQHGPELRAGERVASQV
jgi:hypothetical protein